MSIQSRVDGANEVKRAMVQPVTCGFGRRAEEWRWKGV